jgi:hypothetical protein
LIHACRCGGNFLLAKNDFDELKCMVAEENNLVSKLACALEKDNCQCHEIVEVECETCSLIIGVKVVGTL